MNKTLKLKDKEINDLKKINSEIKTNISEAEAKFTALTTKVNVESKVEDKNQKKREHKHFIDNLKEVKVYKCDKCNSKSETLDGLRSHIRVIHSRSVSTETEDNELDDKSAPWEPFGFWNDKTSQTSEDCEEIEFEKYPCNYCGTNIANLYHLDEHIMKCRGTYNLFTVPGLPVPPAPIRCYPVFYPTLPVLSFKGGSRFCS